MKFECGNGHFAKAVSARQEATQQSAFSATAELLLLHVDVHNSVGLLHCLPCRRVAAWHFLSPLQ